MPWDIEMSALTDGASRRQAFVRVVLPQVTNGIIAISVFSFIRGWEEYIFVFTFLINTVAEIVRQRLRRRYAEI